MKLFARTLIYSALLVGLLAYATWRLYRSPAQVEARIARAIRTLVAMAPRLEGCQEPLFGSLSIRRLELPASPVIKERNIVELTDIRLEGPSSHGVPGFRRKTTTEATRPTIRVSSGRLSLEHRVSGSPGAEVSDWNLTGLFASPAWLDALEASHTQVHVDSFAVGLREVWPLREERHAELSLRDLALRGTASGTREPSGVVLEADLAESPSWTGGRVRVEWMPGAAWRIQASVDGFNEVGRWLPWASEGARALWERFRPQGRFDVDVEELTVSPEGQITFSAVAEHYDTSARLGGTGIIVGGLRGRMQLSRTEAAFPAAPGGREAATVDILGASAGVEGTIQERSGALSFRLRSSTIESLLADVVGSAGGPLEELISRLRPTGQIAGSLTYSYAPDAIERVTGAMRIEGGALAGIQAIDKLDGTLTLERTVGASPDSGGQGKLKIHSAFVRGIGPTEGEVRFRWDASGFTFELSDLKVTPGGAAAPPGAEPAAGGGAQGSGSFIANGAWLAETGLGAFEARWMSLPFEVGFLRAADSRGWFKKPGAGDPGKGKIDFERVEIPPGFLEPGAAGAIQYESGDAVLELELGTERRLVVKSLRLRGEGRCLRGTGEISLSGDVSLVYFLSDGPAHAAVWRLPERSLPSEWRAAAEKQFRAFRISGTIMAPRARELGDMDPIFEARPEGR